MTLKNRHAKTHHQAQEYDRLLSSLKLYNLGDDLRSAMIEAYNSPKWDWTMSDGCSCVSELHYPKCNCCDPPLVFRFPPCTLHDFYWATSSKSNPTRRRIGDKFFLQAMKSYRVSFVRSYARFFGVKIAWHCFFRWRKT